MLLAEQARPGERVALAAGEWRAALALLWLRLAVGLVARRERFGNREAAIFGGRILRRGWLMLRFAF